MQKKSNYFRPKFNNRLAWRVEMWLNDCVMDTSLKLISEERANAVHVAVSTGKVASELQPQAQSQGIAADFFRDMAKSLHPA